MKIVFMGTPDFAVGALRALHEAGHSVVLVVTQPDRPKGRGGAVSISPVKEYCLAHDLSVFQPEKVREEAAVERLRLTKADVFVVAAFGQILPQEVLDIPPYGCVNIHASLLPALRGAAPIQYAILNGDSQTGITIMQMDAGCDTGDILMRQSIPITQEDTGGSLFDSLCALGAQMIVEALQRMEEGSLTPLRQDDAKATLTGKIDKASGRIDWKKDAAYLERQIRAFTPWPGSFSSLQGKSLKLWKASVKTKEDLNAEGVQLTDDMQPGSIVQVTADAFTVLCGQDTLCVTEVQAEGRKRMTVKDYLLGHKMDTGEQFVR